MISWLEAKKEDLVIGMLIFGFLTFVVIFGCC